MFNEEDEDYKKRKERAKQLRSITNINNETDVDYAAKKERARDLRNFAGMNTSNDYENKTDNSTSINEDYMDKINESRTLRNSSGMTTSNDLLIDEYINNITNQELGDNEKLNDAGNTTQNNEYSDIIITQNVNVPKTSNKESKISITPIQNQTLKSQKQSENLVNYTVTTQKAEKEAGERNEEIKKGGYNSINATIATVLKNIEGGVKNSVSGLVDIVTTATAFGVRGLETLAIMANNEKLSDSLNNAYDKIIDFGGDIKERAEYESNVTSRLDNKAVKTMGQVTNTISEMVANQVIARALGVDGTLIQGLSVGGRSAQEVLDENKDEIFKATVNGITKGYTSYFTEKMFDANILTKGQGGSISDKIDEVIFDTIHSKFGREFANKTIGVIGENIEELVEDNIDTLIDKLVNDKDFPTMKEWWENTSETAKITTISTIIMDLLGLGGGRFENKEQDIIARKAQDIINKEGLAITYNTNNVISSSDIGIFYITKFNQDGTVKNIQATEGKPIQNLNKKVNVNPVIVKNTETNVYNIIDNNTGVVLDSSPYSTLIQAEQEFNHKILNLDEASIKGINDKVSKSNIALQNKIIEVANEAEKQLNNMPQKSTEQPQNSNLDNETTNYMGNIENSQNIESNKTLNMEDRTYENVSNKNVKPYSEEHPELSQDIKDMAANFMEDLSNTLPGERYKTGDTWTGQKRSTTKELAEFKDATGVSWDKIGNILNDIYEGKGNYALAKKMEIELDKALTNGYINVYGQNVMPNEEYLKKKGSIEGKDYFNFNDNSIGFLDDEDARIFGMRKKKSNSKISENENIDILNSQTNSLTNKDIMRSIDNFKNAKGTIKRQDVLNIANSLNINLKQSAVLINDTNMSKKAGHNLNPSIINITEIFENVNNKNAKEFREDAIKKAMSEFRDTIITIKDTRTKAEINKKGIEKTFSGNVTEEKIQTADNIKDLIEQGVYGFTTHNPNDNTGILYHHFFTSVNYKGNNGLVRIVIKEYTKNKTMNDKFYYHQLEYINNDKIKDIGSALPRKSGSKDFEPISSINTSISQNNQNVKSETSINNNSMQKIETIYRKFSKDFKEKGYIDLNNKKVNNSKEVADIAQVFRNPNYETFRMLYTKGNTIVGQEAISSRIPGQTKVFEANNKEKGFYKIKDRMKRLDADGYYMVHNHPSGKAVASQTDINTTQSFAKNIPGFKGHVIVNSGTYAIIERENGNLSRLVAHNEMIIENYKPDEIDKLISTEPWTDIKLNSNKQIAMLMHDVKNNSNYSTLILADSQSYPRILLDIPNSFFNMKSSQIDGYIKNISKQNGATRAFVATTNDNVYKSSNKLTTITDSILYSVKDNEIYEEDTFSKHNEDITKTRVFNNSDLKAKNNQSNNIRSMKKNNTEVDNLGRKLSKQQQEFFKDSKVRDEKGNLLIVYHGTEKNFTEFKNKYIQHGRAIIDGFYLTPDKSSANQYGYKIMELYVNIENPLYLHNNNGLIRELINRGYANNIDELISKYNLETDNSGVVPTAKALTKLVKKLGYDGIITTTQNSDAIDLDWSATQIVALNSNQIKNIDNTSPTDNPDIRYLKKNKKRSISSSNNANKIALDKTSETNEASTSTPSIPQNPENVNDAKKMKANIIDNLMHDIVQKSKGNFESDIKISSDIVDKEALLPLNYSKLKQSTLYNLAKKLFNNIHRRTFKNNNENIHVTNSDIDESIAQTLRNPNQKALLKENIAVFSQLDKIIESGIEIQSSNQPISDNKMRQQYSNYKYYYASVYIDGEPSIVQFDTRVQKGTTGKDERHFRLERIYKINEVDSNGGTDKSIIHFSNESTSTPSIPQNPENVNNSKKTSNIEAGKRNAERTDAYIEQEIKKLEATGEWDDSIPVTKMTDIRKSIEDYLGIGVKKGHFRQRAYAIYNTKNDSIRTKEFKDMDSILHEVGHAIDLGNRISLDKEVIADELLKAINKYGGYEGNPRSILLDEGFAEVIREYAIIPEQAKSEYPQSVAVLEGIRANDASFDKFISSTQQQIYNYIHQSPQNRVMSNLSVGEQTDKVHLTKKILKEKFVKLVWDKDYALKSAVKELSNGKKLDPSQNAYILTRLASGVNDKAISIITNGYISLDGTKTFQGLGKLGEILGNNEQKFNDLRAYLVAQRDLEYKAKTLKTGIRTTDSQAVIDKFKNDTQIQRAAKVVYDTLDGVLQYAVDNGLINRADADILRQDNAFYVPFQRVIENNGNQVGKRGEVKSIIKRRTGSELDVKDVLENIVVNSTNIIKQVENNNILRALYKEGENAGIMNNIFEKIPAPMKKIGTENLAIWEKELKNQGIDTDKIDLEKTIDIFVPDNKTDVGNRVTSFIDEDGKRVYLQFSKDSTDIFNTVMNLDSQIMSMVLKINSKLNMPLRYGATMANIGFAIPNMISDTAQAMIYSEAGFIPVVDNALGVLDILTATNKSVAKFMNKVAPEYAKRIDALYTMYEQSGATSSTRMSQYRKSTQEIMRDVYGTKNSEVLGIKDSFKPLKRLLDLMTYIPEVSEQSTRFRVFEKNYSNSIAKGNTELDARIKAAIESRDATQDFGRTGNITREINQIIPFSAARVGSAYTFAEKVKANPKATSMRIAILTAIAMGIKAIGYDDKEIEELNQRKKDDNFIIKLGDKVITIKKPQGILRSIVNFAEYILDLATGHIEAGEESERLVEWLNNAIMDNMPADKITGLVSNAVAPLIENAINKDFYYNTDIVKSYDLDLPDEEQYYDYNSQLAILLGKIFNYSPAKIDNLISGYLGGLGTQITDMIDWASGKLGISAEEPSMGAEQNSVGKRFVVNVNTNSASIDEVYSKKDELTKKLNGGTITADEEKELNRIKEAIKNLSNINKQIKAIKQDLTMSGKEKAEKIRPLQEQKTDTARQALGKELINSNNTSKIESTKFYPSNSTLKNNGYTLTLTEKMKKEYENLAYEKYKQYKKQGLYSDEYLEKLETTCKECAKKSLMQKYRNQLVKSK